VPRNIASATYGFVRFIGGGLAPFVAGKLVERYNAHVPFLLGAAVVLVGAGVILTVRRALDAADAGGAETMSPRQAPDEAAALPA